jgi:cytochrome c556
MKRKVMKLSGIKRSLVLQGKAAHLLACVITTCTLLGVCRSSVAQDHAAADRHVQMHKESEADSRQPLKILPMMAQHQKQNMREHLVAVQEIVAALSVNDFSGVEQAAQPLGYSPKMAAMCDNLGAATPGFSERGKAFHHTADGIAEAARKQDQAAVMVALSKTLETCTACHAMYRQEVVDQQTWERLSAVPLQH